MKDENEKPWNRAIVLGPDAIELIRKAGQDARELEEANQLHDLIYLMYDVITIVIHQAWRKISRSSPQK